MDAPAHQPLGFDGAVAVVTGGGSGIGAALCRRLSTEGAFVVVADIDAAGASRVADSLATATARHGSRPSGAGGVAAALDVTDGEAVARMVRDTERRFGPVELYFSNAGLGTGGGLGTDDDWARSWQVHAMAHVHAARAVLPAMASRGRGHFVVTASAAGLLMMMQSAPYTVTKHAAVALAEWLAVDYGASGVGVHCLCPQGVRTPMLSGDSRGEAEVAASGKVLEASEVAEHVVESVRTGTFLILPHPEVHGYEQAKVGDRDRWLGAMRRLLAKVSSAR